MPLKMFKIFTCVFLLPTSFPPCLQVTTPEVMMPSSMFLPAAAPEKDGNSTAEELGKQPGECGSTSSMGPTSPPAPTTWSGTVWGRLHPGELPVPSCLLRTTVGRCPAELSPFICAPNRLVPRCPRGRAEQGGSELRSAAHHCGDSRGNGVESLQRRRPDVSSEKQRWRGLRGLVERRQRLRPQSVQPPLLYLICCYRRSSTYAGHTVWGALSSPYPA